MAENNFNDTVESLFKGMDTFITTKTVVGDAVRFEDGTIILPLVDVSFGVAAGAASTELNGAKDVSVNSLTEKTQLKNLLTWLEFYLQYTMIDSTDDRQGDHNYNYKKIKTGMQNMFETLVRMPVLYKDFDQTYPNNEWSIYPGKGARLTSDFNYKSDKTKIDFIMTEILNCSQEDLKTLNMKKQQLNEGPTTLDNF